MKSPCAQHSRNWYNRCFVVDHNISHDIPYVIVPFHRRYTIDRIQHSIYDYDQYYIRGMFGNHVSSDHTISIFLPLLLATAVTLVDDIDTELLAGACTCWDNTVPLLLFLKYTSTAMSDLSCRTVGCNTK